MRLSVDLILYEICCGQGQALSLRYDIEFNLITAESGNIFANLFGGSKPPPYRETHKKIRSQFLESVYNPK